MAFNNMKHIVMIQRVDWSWIFLWCSILVAVIGQVFAKAGAGVLSDGGSLFNVYILLGYIGLLLRGFFWILAIRSIALSRAYPMTSLSYIGVFFLSVVFLHESYTPVNVIGLACIVGGVVLIGEKP